ncbi:MAG: Rrf2 family transcriptional regulator [Humidesulfovibrio sp.]|nr:Rrf2 family transcriptional regulator [Humidesulfovibrio sp.]
MKLSAKARYAVRILLDLAIHDANAPIRTADISERTGVSARFIEQILKPLKKEALVQSTRGASGGYVLSEKPQDISLARVIRAIEGGLSLTHCCENPESCLRSETCRSHRAWQRVTWVMEAEFEGISIKDLQDDRILDPRTAASASKSAQSGNPTR